MTTQVERELELATYRTHLEELAEDRTRDLRTFSYALAHDLRTPISAMAGFAGAVITQTDPKSNRQAYRHLQRFVANGHRAESLIAGILELMRTADAPNHKELVDLTRLAEQSAEQLRMTEPLRAVKLSIAPGMKVHADVRLAMSVLDNLLGNVYRTMALASTWQTRASCSSL